jgi:hypothetical protein
MKQASCSTRFAVARGACGLLAIFLLSMAGGCGGDAQLMLAGADAIEVIAGQQQQAIDEYHAELQSLDDDREAAVVDAFIVRIERDVPGDPSSGDAHAAAFRQALAKIRADRDVEYARHGAASDNTGELCKIAEGLRQVALESLTFQDELRRYVTGLIEARRRAAEQSEPQAPQEESDAQ